MAKRSKPTRTAAGTLDRLGPPRASAGRRRDRRESLSLRVRLARLGETGLRARLTPSATVALAR
jgi:hypothetical protein